MGYLNIMVDGNSSDFGAWVAQARLAIAFLTRLPLAAEGAAEPGGSGAGGLGVSAGGHPRRRGRRHRADDR